MPLKSTSSARRPRRQARVPRRKRVARKRVSRPSRGLRSSKIQGISGGLTESAVSLSAKRMRMDRRVVALGAPAHYQIVNGYDLLGSAFAPPASGQQTPVILGQWNSVADINGFQAQIPTIATIGGDTPTRFCLHSLKAVCTLNNPTSQTMYVDLYDIVARKDIPTAIATGATYAVSLPTQAWELSLFQQANSPIAFPASLQMGAVPTDGQLFNDYYKIVSKRSVVLPQNATHVHTVGLKLEKAFDKGELIVQSKYIAGWKDCTYYTMAVVRGQPCYDETSLLTTTITPALRWVVSEHYTYSWLQASGSVNTFQNVLPYGLAVVEKVLQLNNPTAGAVIGV